MNEPEPMSVGKVIWELWRFIVWALASITRIAVTLFILVFLIGLWQTFDAAPWETPLVILVAAAFGYLWYSRQRRRAGQET